MSFSTRSWRSPETLLILLAVGSPLAFYTWMTLLNNFAVEQAAFTGIEIGILQSLREVPGFLTFTVVFVLLIVKEQPFAVLALALLGVGTAITGFFPTVYGLYFTTVVMSVGYHYFESIHQSLSLQWLDKRVAAEALGRIVAASSFAGLVAFGLIYFAVDTFGVAMKWVYVVGGCSAVVIAIACWLFFPRMESVTVQHKHIVIRKRYWLYYCLQFMGGARRQIFVVFAGFLMVEKFGFSPGEVALLYLANGLLTMLTAPIIGKLIGRFGERRALIIEYIGLIAVFTGYAFVETASVAVALYILDHLFFSVAIAMKTYLQKIADPADIASTSGVSFTINHIAAVVLPAAYGFLWIISPGAVFLSGAALAGVSLALAMLVPRTPSPDNVARVGPWKGAPSPPEEPIEQPAE
ncbi:MAG: MFS transporter [Rhodospirillales bacterium]|jgi:predicted MFS family arabinose efflux permease|nr:MFS transporter [Rhodospirillales bacterium]MBT4039452.1 MFS transporter [Rhodospirillales bacterium]MBT4627090.1 MFS transporter [Rhodospirillales bacterium]MBT5352414.1 MFS transporter [Rhodospirillales bacterium]MBT5520428.1 MFS transporter [Rhodospirillales bacterium]